MIEKSVHLKPGNELERLLNGEMKIAVFYKAVGENFEIVENKLFSDSVKSGKIIKKTFFVVNDGQSFKIFYTVYAQRHDEWRIELYRSLKKIGQHIWSKDLETIESLVISR